GPQLDVVQAGLGVALVVVKADEGERADIDLLPAAVRLLDRQNELFHGLVPEAVDAVFDGDIAGEGVETVGPPKAGAVVVIESKRLFRQGSGRAGADGQVPVKDVVDLGAVFQEVAVALAPVADIIANNQIIRAVDGQPAVGAVPDGGANHK